jgi:hypothetical protein
MPLTTDISHILRPGVFLLRKGERVVYIGKAKCILIALAHHALRNRASKLPDWFPVRAIQFDGIEVIPCDISRATDLHRALVALHDPLYNRPDKPTRQPSTPTPTSPQPSPSQPLIRRL